MAVTTNQPHPFPLAETEGRTLKKDVVTVGFCKILYFYHVG